MKLEDKSLRIGTIVVVCAVLLRLFGGGISNRLITTLSSPDLISLLLYLETGRTVKAGAPEPPDKTTPSFPETNSSSTENTTAPEPPEQEQPAQTVFSSDDAALVQVNNVCGLDADVPAFLQTPLQWDLTKSEPAVLILHSHATESYKKTESYKESSPYRTLNTKYNMVSIGDRIAATLEKNGIAVIHDRTLHDYPSYSDSYVNTRDAVKKYLEEYPSIRLVLDIHRDSAVDENGNQVKHTVSTKKGDAAQLMLVIGTDAGGLRHPDWESNMALAVKLHARLEQRCRGICRPISFCSQRFNQDLSPGAILIEVGAAGNTRQEALLTADILAKSICDLSYGSA